MAKASKIKNKVETKESASSGLVAALRQMSLYVHSPSMRTILLATAMLWFLHCFFYLGVAINANNFTSTDPFLYVALTGLMDGVSILLTTPLTPYLGRRTIVGLELFVGGVLLLLELLVSVDYYWAKWILVMSGFLMVSGAFQVSYVYAPELFPTEARTRGFAFINIFGSFGNMFASIVTTMIAQTAWWAASVTFGCSGIIGSFMVTFLPETNNQPLPETLQDVEDRTRSSRQRGVANKAYENCETVI